MRELFIQNTMVIHRGKRECKPADIYIENGIVREIAERLNPPGNCLIMDVEGAYVSTGWVDAHTHIAWGDDRPGLDGRYIYPRDGLTCVVDAGTAGPCNYGRIHEKIASSNILVKAYLNVAREGISLSGGELKSMEYLDRDLCYQTYEAYRDEIIGIKIRIDPRVNSDIMESLRQAREIADHLGLPMIVHPSRCTQPLEKILPLFKKGDVFAHTYSALEPCILDSDGKVKDCVLEARRRGVWFDLSHGSSNFSFDTAKQAMEQGFVVDTISTDLHTMNLAAPVRSMADVMSKMLCLGMSIEDIIEKVTEAPLIVLGIHEKSSDIKVGNPADLTIFKVNEGAFLLKDSYGNARNADRRFEVLGTVVKDTLYFPRRCNFYHS